jgi:hypothetical protein
VLGNFLEKMLGELNAGGAKSCAHVYENLSLYLSGGLKEWRAQVSPDCVSAYDLLRLDSPAVAKAVIRLLPHDSAGEALVPSAGRSAAAQTGKVIDFFFDSYPDVKIAFSN